MRIFRNRYSKTVTFTVLTFSVFFLLTLTAFTPTASAQGENVKQIRVVARSSNDVNWQIITSGAFGQPQISAGRGENLIILASNPETGESIPKGEGMIKGHIISGNGSGSALLQQKFEVPAWARPKGTTSGQKAKSWSSKTLNIISNLNRGTEFARKGGVKLPITDDFPQAMAITIDAPNFKPLTFKLTIGGEAGEQGQAEEIDVNFPSAPYEVGKSEIIKVMKGNQTVQLDSVNITGPEISEKNPNPGQGLVRFVPEKKGMYTVNYTVNGKSYTKTFHIGETEGSGIGGNIVPVVVVAALIIIAVYVTYSKGYFHKLAGKEKW